MYHSIWFIFLIKSAESNTVTSLNQAAKKYIFDFKGKDFPFSNKKLRVNNFGTLFLKIGIEYPRTSLRVLIILGQNYHGNWFLSPSKARLWLLERPIYQNYFQFRILFGIFNFWVRFKKPIKPPVYELMLWF